MKYFKHIVKKLFLHGLLPTVIANMVAMHKPCREFKNIVVQSVRRQHNPARFAMLENPRGFRLNPLLHPFLIQNMQQIKRELLALEYEAEKKHYYEQEIKHRPVVLLEESEIACISKTETSYGTSFTVTFKNGGKAFADHYHKSRFHKNFKRAVRYGSTGMVSLPANGYDEVAKLYEQRQKAKKTGKKS